MTGTFIQQIKNVLVTPTPSMISYSGEHSSITFARLGEWGISAKMLTLLTFESGGMGKLGPGA